MNPPSVAGSGPAAFVQFASAGRFAFRVPPSTKSESSWARRSLEEHRRAQKDLYMQEYDQAVGLATAFRNRYLVLVAGSFFEIVEQAEAWPNRAMLRAVAWACPLVPGATLITSNILVTNWLNGDAVARSEPIARLLDAACRALQNSECAVQCRSSSKVRDARAYARRLVRAAEAGS